MAFMHCPCSASASRSRRPLGRLAICPAGTALKPLAYRRSPSFRRRTAAAHALHDGVARSSSRGCCSSSRTASRRSRDSSRRGLAPGSAGSRTGSARTGRTGTAADSSAGTLIRRRLLLRRRRVDRALYGTAGSRRRRLVADRHATRWSRCGRRSRRCRPGRSRRWRGCLPDELALTVGDALARRGVGDVYHRAVLVLEVGLAPAVIFAPGFIPANCLLS